MDIKGRESLPAFLVTMKKLLIIIFAFFVAGCASFISHSPKTLSDSTAVPYYTGRKARIAVVDFDNKSTNATGDVGSGLRDMLASALVNSNRFVVSNKEPSTEDKKADLIIAATITGFEPPSSGGRNGMGGGGGSGNGDMGGLLGVSSNKARIAIDIRIINALNSQVIELIKVQAQAVDNVIASVDNWALSNNLALYANTAMEKAVRRCLVDAVRYIVQNIPAGYYKY